MTESKTTIEQRGSEIVITTGDMVNTFDRHQPEIAADQIAELHELVLALQNRIDWDVVEQARQVAVAAAQLSKAAAGVHKTLHDETRE